MPTPENAVKQAVRKWLIAQGCQPAGGRRPAVTHGWFWMPVAGALGVVGVPDFIVCYRGRFYGIETKAPGKRAALTENQKQRHAEIRAAGGVVYVVDDVAQLPLVLG